ncbi:hypothetical protein ACOMHN_049966 [Nucella lapillus]
MTASNGMPEERQCSAMTASNGMPEERQCSAMTASNGMPEERQCSAMTASNGMPEERQCLPVPSFGPGSRSSILTSELSTRRPACHCEDCRQRGVKPQPTTVLESAEPSHDPRSQQGHHSPQ